MKRMVARVLAVAMVVAAVGVQSSTVFAASLTSLSDNMSRLQASTASNHEIKFVTPSGGGVAAGETITITFSADFTGVSSLDFGDADFAVGDSNNCVTANFTEQTLAAAPSGATWGFTTSGQVTTLTSGTGTVTADRCVRFELGTNATTGVTGDTQITNGAIDDDDTISIAGTFGDTGTISVDIITDDQVDITATVDPSITFSISDNSVGFGTLSASDDRYATGDTLGNSSETVAHTLAAGTNASGGYAMYVLGSTLTSGGNTIDAIGGSATASTLGTEQFGFKLVDDNNGTGTATAPYDTSNYAFVAGAQDQVASAGGATATTTYDVTYVANILSNTEAGSYSTTLTYTATATF